MYLFVLLFILLYSISPVTANEYLLGVGDKIVRSGIISFPFFKYIQVIGLSLQEVESKVHACCRKNAKSMLGY